MAPAPLRAVIYVATRHLDDTEPSMNVCLRYCDKHNYAVAAVVVDPTGESWPQIPRILADGEADIVVVADCDQLAPDRVPRLECVTQPALVLPRGRHRRPRRPFSGTAV